MASTFTTNLNLEKPGIGEQDGDWGATLNSNFDGLDTAIASKVSASGTATLTNKTIDADNNTISNLEVDNLKSGVLDTDISSVSASDDTLASAKSIKTYVDAQIATKDNTDEITEGSTNLYFTNARADARITNALKDEDDMASNSATHVPSQQSVKAYVDAQDAAIASDTLTFTNKTFDVEGTGNSISNIDVADLKSGVLDTDISSVSGSDDTLASAKAIKTYVDAQVATKDTLAELSDTSISSPAAGHLLIYDNTQSHFENATLTAGSNVSITNADGQITIAATDTNTQLSQEQVEDFVGGMLDGTETFIDVSYDDTDGNIDFVVPVKDEDDFASNSDTHLATQQSIKAYVDANAGGSVALDDIGVGDAESTLATSAGNIIIDAQGDNTDIVFKGTDGGADTTFLTLDGSDAGSATFNNKLEIGNTLTIDGDNSSTAQILFRTTTQFNSSFAMQVFASRFFVCRKVSTATAVFFAFHNNSGTQIGTVTASESATAYNTTSDYRLKENVVNITDGITRLKQLKPKRFNFIMEPDITVDGFIAHEVTAVPEAISGEKDAVDDDGNIDPQGIDQSKLVPLLTAALQEAVAKIEALETRVAALEG